MSIALKVLYGFGQSGSEIEEKGTEKQNKVHVWLDHMLNICVSVESLEIKKLTVSCPLQTWKDREMYLTDLG